RHRPGYWATKPDDNLLVAAAAAAPKPSPEARALAAAFDKSIVPRGRSVRTWIGVDRDDGGNTQVMFVWEPQPSIDGETRPDRSQPAGIQLTAAGTGQLYFRGRVPSAQASSASGAVIRRVVFEAQPGKMDWQLAVEGTDGGIIDTEQGSFDVPDLRSSRTM